ncbi:MAG TPA: ABC transporter substrate-binding protein [Xanthobacteraceae bacterium]|nr:ABC transporter substrate-binding protein [Xanthobacteraceae bacterium]
MKRSALTLSLAVVACLTGLTRGAAAQDAVKVGLIMTYTGVFADAATQMDNGIKLFMKENGDTVAGRKVEIIRRDAGVGSVEVAQRLAQELIVRDRVDVLAGFVTTPTALAATELSKESKKLMVIMNAATSLIPDRSPYIVRTSNTIPQDSEPLGRWAYANGLRKVFTLALDLAPGIDAENAFQRVFKAAGGEIVGSVRFPITTPDFGVYVQRAKDANPDGIMVFVPGGAQPAALGKALAERGISTDKIKVMGNDVLTDDSALKSMGDIALGIITASHYDHYLKNPGNARFVAAYREMFGRNPDIFSIGGYDGMHLIYEALKKTGGKADGDSLVAAAKGMSWVSPRGPMSIDPETRDVVQSVYIRKVEKVNNELVNVEFEKFENVKDPVKAAQGK